MKARDALVRGLVVACALLIAGWLALGLRSSILDERGRDQLTKGLPLKEPSPAQARTLRRGARNLERAAWLNPDPLPRAYHAQVLVILGQDARARGIIREVTRAEPDNVEIWRVARAIGFALPDRGLEVQARRRLSELTAHGSR